MNSVSSVAGTMTSAARICKLLCSAQMRPTCRATTATAITAFRLVRPNKAVADSPGPQPAAERPSGTHEVTVIISQGIKRSDANIGMSIVLARKALVVLGRSGTYGSVSRAQYPPRTAGNQRQAKQKGQGRCDESGEEGDKVCHELLSGGFLAGLIWAMCP